MTSDSLNRHIGFSVWTFNESTYIPQATGGYNVYTQDPSVCVEQVMNATVNRVTKGIAIFNSKDPPLNTRCEGYEPSFATIEICEVKVMGCDFQQYGENCKSCPLECWNQVCDAFNGSCIYGCSNWLLEPPDCIKCRQRFYGANCESRCSKCTIGSFCDNKTGICPVGCQDHWNGTKCDECKNGFHGANCEFNCSKCTNGTFCDNITGICPEGCQEHWNGTRCDVCENGFYGANCEFSCSKCTIGTLCDKITGICPEGCHDHWNGTRCEVCREGFYGQSCEEKCGHCRNTTFCNITTGVCTDGCKDNWDGLMCNVCSNGYYGNHCKNKCGHCLKGTHCNKSSGVCPRGCKENWTGSKCDECEDYKYGQNCAYDCGHCKDETKCSKVTGKCKDGCMTGWSGLFCSKELSYTEKGSDDWILKVSTAVISVISTLFVVILIVLARNVYRKIKKRNVHIERDAPEIMSGKLYDQLVETNTDPTYQKISPQSEVSHYQEMNVYKNHEFVQN
ncbi:multiple epidermal growth factor-like domains protein 10 [Saccostrea cucullata]|uniref:multiple epidermal growth factor-like domains protein 10 n=1 Tax=Saccostrea cuccullata TaxID=36930 RepID=UPI002ED1E998